MKRALLVALSVLAATGFGQESAFTQRLRAEFERSGNPGFVAAVFRDGKVVYKQAFGLSDVEGKTPMTADHAFEVGSVSKQFVAVCVLMLVEEKKLRLDMKLSEALPSAPSKWHHVTVEHLLRHISGVPDYEEIATYDFYNQARTPQEIFDQALKKDLDFPAGDKYSYSNTGYVLLSLIVERASATPIGEFLETKIFRPLGMTHTYASSVPTKATAASGYHSRTGARKKQPPIAWTSTLGAGGIVSTVDDMLKWDEALYGERLLRREVLAQVWTKGRLNDGGVSNYGFGWIIDQFRGFDRQQHSGQTNGFTCYYLRYPAQHTSVLVWTNTYGGNIGMPATMLAAQFVPGMSYLTRTIPQDPDPSRTQTHLKALKQAVLAEGDMALLSEFMKGFATKDEYRSIRNEAVDYVRTAQKLEFMSVTPRSDNRQSYLYKLTHAEGAYFFTMTFRDGLLVGLNWEPE